jgi:tetratricopeptide (TPR) repeat protein
MVACDIFRVLALSIFLYSGDSAFELYSIGNQLELEGKINEAIEYYERAQALDPNATEIYISLAGALYMVQRFEEGIVHVQNALKIEPNNPRLYKIIALGYVGKRDLSEATKYYLEAIQLEANNLENYFATATLLEASKEIEKAIAVLEEMPEEMRTVDVYVQLGALAGKLNDHHRAIAYYQKGHALDTTNVVTTVGTGTGFDMMGSEDSAIYYYEAAHEDTFILTVAQRLVELYTEMGRYNNVIPIAEQILMNDPGNIHVRQSLGYAYYKLQMPTSALNEFYIALRYDPRDTYSAFYLARIYLEEGENDRALAAINNALRIDEDFLELWIYLGFIAIEMKEYDLAGHAFSEAAYRGGDLAQIYYLLGAIAEAQEINDEAYRYYKKTLGENSKNISALEGLANLTSQMGRDDETFRIFQRILEIDTLNAVALNYIGYSYAERKDSLDYALQLVDRALAIDQSNGYYIDSRGWIFYMMGKYEAALGELKRAAALVEDPVIFEHLGDICRKLDDRDNAKNAYEKALELDPNNEALQRKLNELQ